MAEFKVNTDRLGSDAGNVKGYTDRIQQKMNNLTRYLAELDAMWDGPASETFKKAYKDDLVALSAMVSNMAKIYAYENTAKAKYERCEQQVMDAVSGL